MLPSKLVRLFKNVFTYGCFLLTFVLLLNVFLKERHEKEWRQYEVRRLQVRKQQADVSAIKSMKLDEVVFDEYVPFKVFFEKTEANHTLPSPVFHNGSSLKDRPFVETSHNDPNYSVLKRVKGFSYDIFLFSAVVGNSSSKRPWDTIVLQGWEHKTYEHTTFGCCIIYKSGKMVTVKAVKKVHWAYRNLTKMPVKQYVCPNELYMTGDRPELVTLCGTTSRTACHKLYNWYIVPTYAYEHKDKIAVCAKLVYGDLPADDIITWFEIHRLLGMHKVLLYTYNLNPDATAVLDYYRAVGMAEVVPFTLPKATKEHKKVEIGVKNMQAWNDEQVPVYHCLEKLRGYKYMVMLDVDEYIIPKRTKDWMELFDKLFANSPKAAGFTFLVQLHITSWGVTGHASEFKVGQYLNRSKTMTDRMKHVTRPERLQQGGLSTHQYVPIWDKGYKRYRAVDGEAVIHHFRSCRKEWKKKTRDKCQELERFTDTSVAKILSQIESELLELRSTILGV